MKNTEKSSSLKPSGIYVHIPFCRQACHYCNFHFSTNLNSVSDLIEAICLEIELKSKLYGAHNITTLYFGGGTPSLLPFRLLKKIFDTLQKKIDLKNLKEVTIECNPEDIDNKICDQFHQLGVTRVSLGIQSFQDDDLQYMNRNHNAKKGFEAIELLKKNNLSNLSIDLIYGTPTLSLNDWLKNIQIACSYNIPHLSCYALTVEEGTALPAMIKNNKRAAPDDETMREQFLILRKELLEKKYGHYEISNFALDGFHAIHNTNYWMGNSYIGFGPGAHSYDGNKRYWNISHNTKYTKSIHDGIIPEEIEILSDQNKFNEQIMTSLRTSVGLDVQQLEQKYPLLISDYFRQEINDLIAHKKAEWKSGHLTLTEKGLLLCDQISSNLFIL